MAPQQSRVRTGRLMVVAATIVASAALASHPGFAAGTVRLTGTPAPNRVTPAPAVTPPPPAPAVTPPPPAPAVTTPPAPVVTTPPAPVVTPPPAPAVTTAPAPAVTTPTAVITPPAPTVTPPPVTTPALSVPEPSTPLTPAPATGTTTPVPLAETPAFGAFLGSGPLGVARIAGFSRWLGGADVRVGHTYLPGDSWSDIEGDPRFLAPWARWRTEQDNRMLVLNVPMQERNEEDLSDDDVRLLLRQGAAGQFDDHFRVLAERLVAAQVPDTVVVLGWEMNGSTYTHRCGPDPEAWKAYWNRIVTTMRSVPGQRFRFDFAPSRGLDAVAWTQCYPGDSTVDIIGMDSYDQPRGISFDEQVTEPYGLQAQVDFATLHGKPISYPEWGLFRNGDDPGYVRRMLAWIDQHKPVYNTITDYCPHGVWRCGSHTLSSLVYRSALFRLGRPTASATPTASVAEPPPPVCSPLVLGDLIKRWPGGLLCLRPDWWLHSR
ncbi:hypothetical protein M2271_001291 [Streptomyces sp. LBL]|uniref:glycoside hydrolase family 26 protein n=1 Tax=Streptomyces sp. LBL TaxID=2940562 RepID=UPI002476D039|nr:glycosyl hydrolase [Streptomyces sp. LBL]MDH6623504.1 hypothetical protein [Streptomyces sp. LBL]